MGGTVHVKAMGCKVSQAEASYIIHEAAARGLTPVFSPDDADVIVLNSCTVTSRSDADTRQTLRRLHSDNPRAKIVIAGCFPRIEKEINDEFKPFCTAVSSSDQKKVVDAVIDVFSTEINGLQQMNSSPTNECFDKIYINKNRSRPFLKIQDGCNSACSYCIVPLARGPSISIPVNNIIEELKNYLSAGFKEVVLVGIHIGLYGKDLRPESSILELLRKIEKVVSLNNMARIRLTSIEPFEAQNDLLDYIAGNPFVCRHLHLPLQSGSNRILALMNRPYTCEQYLDRLIRIKKSMPDACVGADIISGFPGETDQDHLTTVKFIEDSPLDYLHVFTFSPRPRTRAFSMSSRPASTVVSKRVQELINIGKRKRAAFHRSMINKYFSAILEGSNSSHGITLLTDNYIKATCTDTKITPDDFYKILINGADENGTVTASIVQAGGSDGQGR